MELQMVRNTKEEACETRNHILDAAEEVFHAGWRCAYFASRYRGGGCDARRDLLVF
jgi:hypothetical protein